MKYLRIHNISIHINFYQNRFINECVIYQIKITTQLRSILREKTVFSLVDFIQNECVMKNFLKFSYRRKDGKAEFFVRCRKLTFLINNIIADSDPMCNQM